jgi:hypothetical protein
MEKLSRGFSSLKRVTVPKVAPHKILRSKQSRRIALIRLSGSPPQPKDRPRFAALVLGKAWTESPTEARLPALEKSIQEIRTEWELP